MPHIAPRIIQYILILLLFSYMERIAGVFISISLDTHTQSNASKNANLK